MPSLAGADWPAVTWATTEWSPQIPRDLLTKAQRARHHGPYQSAVVPHIAGQPLKLPEELLVTTADASAMITRFDAVLGSEIAPFATILLRSEAAASSQIENLSSGAKQIALAELGSREKRNASEIVGNVAAMNAALSLADDLNTDAVLAMHRALMERHAPDIAGRWRTEPVWIGGSAVGPHGADYIAPQAQCVPELMHDALAFAQRRDLPPLAHIALTHAQVETIHPFPDGNGRTGRALIQAMLRAHDLTRNVTVPVSAGLLTDTENYFQALTAYRRGDVAPIIRAVSEAALSAVTNGTALVAEIRAIRTDWDTRLTVRSDAAARRLLDVLLRQPVIDARTAAESIGISPANASRALRPLVDARILSEFTGFTRDRMWCATDVTGALDDFAARARRGAR